jgi:hypothetical protein
MVGRAPSTSRRKGSTPVGLSDRDYMKRTPEELRRDYGVTPRSRVRLDSRTMAWIVGLVVATYAARRIGIPIP